MFSYASSARERGIQVIIAGAGGAAHLPGRNYLRMMFVYNHIYISVHALNIVHWIRHGSCFDPLACNWCSCPCIYIRRTRLSLVHCTGITVSVFLVSLWQLLGFFGIERVVFRKIILYYYLIGILFSIRKGPYQNDLTRAHISFQMPRGVPVATVAINNATNAGLLAVRLLGISDFDLQARWGYLVSSRLL